MYTMEKRATGADRARKRIHTSGEALVPAFSDDGQVRVQTSRNATVNALRRAGWRVVSHDTGVSPAVPAQDKAPAPPPADDPPTDHADDGQVPERLAELKAMTVKQLRFLARDLDIRGRSNMDEDELCVAIMDAEA